MMKAPKRRLSRGFGGQVGIRWLKRATAGANVEVTSSCSSGFLPATNKNQRSLAAAVVEPADSSWPFSRELSQSGRALLPTTGEQPSSKAMDTKMPIKPFDSCSSRSLLSTACKSASSVLGWDDILCRPVYSFEVAGVSKSAATASTASGTDDNSSEDEAEAKNCIDPSHERRGSYGSDQHSSIARCVTQEDSASATPSWIPGGSSLARHGPASGRRNKPRSYSASSKRMRVVALLASRNVNLHGRSGQVDDRKDSLMSNSSALNDCSNLEPLEASVCSKADTALDELDFFPEEGAQGLHVHRKRRRMAVASFRTPPNQPTSVTSASVARKFFRHLDSQHPLVLDRSSTPAFCDTARWRGACVDGRSARRILENNPIVAQEYRQYEHACREVGVTPLSWKHFLKQRCLYHGAIYEGMLDD